MKKKSESVVENKTLNEIEKQINVLSDEQFSLQKAVSEKQKAIQKLKEARHERIMEQNQCLIDFISAHNEAIMPLLRHKYEDCDRVNHAWLDDGNADCPVCALESLFYDSVYAHNRMYDKRIVFKIEFENID